MLKKLLLVAVAAGLVSATTLPLQISPAEAVGLRGMPCKDAAAIKFPDDRQMRRSWNKLCKENWKLHQGY
jgi:hypothetical protein